ncbi:MAG: hypothetical protein HYW79_00385 [Parcubacteria group bacterium]|nr:hypothetical protein [Parcubacteria group bacterium]
MNPVRNKKSEIFADTSEASRISNGMKILIGTPIHECKDYCMERWLENVAKLQQQTPANLFLVDNSPGLDYVEKIKNYCAKYGITNYKIEHLEINQAQGADERIGRSREIIRQEILSHDYDAWFSWECDQIIPANALDKLIDIMKIGDYAMVSHGSWSRKNPGSPENDLGCALIKGVCLEKYSFLLQEYWDLTRSWHAGARWFKHRLLKGGDNYIEVYGVVAPIYHLNE